MSISFLGVSQIASLASASITLSQASTTSRLHGAVPSASATPQTSVFFLVHYICGSQGSLFKVSVSSHQNLMASPIRAKLKMCVCLVAPHQPVTSLVSWTPALLSVLGFTLFPLTRGLGVCSGCHSYSAVNSAPPQPTSSAFLQVRHHCPRTLFAGLVPSPLSYILKKLFLLSFKTFKLSRTHLLKCLIDEMPLTLTMGMNDDIKDHTFHL